MLALDSFARTRRVVSSAINDDAGTSPFFSILARYRHARLLERTGHPAEAKAEYEDFLAHWGHADRPVPEIDDARAAVARLGAAK